MTAVLAALVLLPLGGGVLLLVAGRARPALVPALAVGAAAGTLALACLAAAGRPAVRFPLFAGLPGGLRADGPAGVLAVTTALVTLLVLVYAAGDIGGARPRFFGFTLLFAGAMLVTVLAADLAVLLMGWEVMGAASYALIGFRWDDGARVRSAATAFLTTRAADLGLYVAAGCAYAGARTLDLDALAAAPAPWRDAVAAGIVLAALGKSAQLPFSFWLSRAMAGPSPVSALLHSATMVAAGAYLLLRTAPLLHATGWAAPLVAWAGALTALLLGGVALAQRELKQILAASTCAQLGFTVLAAGTGAVAGGTAQLVAHAAVKSLLFLCAGIWLGALGTGALDGLRGAARRNRVVGACFCAGAWSLAGLPPFALWATKDAALAAAPWPLAAVGVAASALAAAYATRAARALLAPLPPAAPAARGGAVRGGALRVLPLPVLAVASAGAGLSALPPVAGEWRRVLGVPGERGPEWWEFFGTALIAGVVAVLVGIGVPVRGAAVARVFGLRAVARVFEGWLGLERGAFAVVRGVRAAAGGLARFDDRVVDGGVRAAAAGARRAAALAARADPDPVVEAVARAFRALGGLARRPQTGQLHLYYAQAAVVLLAVVLAVALAG